MSRPAPPSAARGRRSPSLAGFTSAVLLMLGAATASLPASSGCSTQETSPAPDAAPPPCEPGPFVYCEPVGADQLGCNTDEGTSQLLQRLPRATRYPVDCSAYFVGERDEQGDCKHEVCKCVISNPTPAPADGGLDPDAAPPAPPGDPIPIWNCTL